jgi:hypothetical protein
LDVLLVEIAALHSWLQPHLYCPDACKHTAEATGNNLSNKQQFDPKTPEG